MRFSKIRTTEFCFSLALLATLPAMPILAQNHEQNSGTSQPPVQSSPKDAAPKDAQRTISGPYRLTYTLTDMDSAKRIGSQRYQIVLDADAGRAHVKLGTSIPVYIPGAKDYTTVHIGIELIARLHKFQNGLELSSEIDQTVLADSRQHESQATNAQPPPITRDSELYSAVLIQDSRPVILGRLDIPGSTRSLEIQVELTRVR